MNAFSSANLAVVAYAEVAADGTSTVTNSGVGTTRLTEGRYAVILPTDKQQLGARDLIIVTAKHNPATPWTTVPWFSGILPTTLVIDTDPAIKGVETGTAVAGLATLVDMPFSVLILRTVIPPPAGSPA